MNKNNNESIKKVEGGHQPNKSQDTQGPPGGGSNIPRPPK